MEPLEDLAVFREAGWNWRSVARDEFRAWQTGHVDLELCPISADTLALSIDLGPVTRVFTFAKADLTQTVADLIIERQPTVTRGNFRELVRDLVLAGATLTTLVDGERVQVTAEPGDESRRTPWWRRWFG